MSCANTSLPWFIEPPRAMLTGRAAKPKFEIQIEAKKINRLWVFHQQLTGAENPNVGTLLLRHIRSIIVPSTAISRPGGAHQRFRNEGKMSRELGRFSVALKSFSSGNRVEGEFAS